MKYVKPYRNGWRAQLQFDGERESKTFKTEAEAIDWVNWRKGLAKESNTQKAILDRIKFEKSKLLSFIPKRVLLAMNSVPLSVEEIIGASIPLGTQVGIYFLIRNDEVIYVGQSIDILNRVSKHRREGKVFDSYSFIECAKENLNLLESTYITALIPELNQTFGNAVLALA